MNWFPNLLLLPLYLLACQVVKAQPGNSTTHLYWKIAVAENGRTTTIDSSTWRKVEFYSANAEIRYRFIPQTNYFELELSSMRQPELTVQVGKQQLYFPQIEHYSMGYYKMVVLGLEPRYYTGSGRASRSFFNDPEEHLRYRVHNSSDVVTICPRNILVKGHRNDPQARPLNHNGLISLTRYRTAGEKLYCRLRFSTRVDTVAVPTDLQPRSPIRLSLHTESPDKADCYAMDSLIYHTELQLPVFSSSYGGHYQLAVDDKAVNNTLLIPHRYIFTRTGLPENWVKIPRGYPPSSLPDTRTLYSNRQYLVTLKPINPTRFDTLHLTFTNRFFDFFGTSADIEYRWVEPTQQMPRHLSGELRISIRHDCGAGEPERSQTYRLTIPPPGKLGTYRLTFLNGFAEGKKMRTTEKHCFEWLPEALELDLK